MNLAIYFFLASQDPCLIRPVSVLLMASICQDGYIILPYTAAEYTIITFNSYSAL
jgi:hypothetical protein